MRFKQISNEFRGNCGWSRLPFLTQSHDLDLSDDKGRRIGIAVHSVHTSLFPDEHGSRVAEQGGDYYRVRIQLTKNGTDWGASQPWKLYSSWDEVEQQLQRRIAATQKKFS